MKIFHNLMKNKKLKRLLPYVAIFILIVLSLYFGNLSYLTGKKDVFDDSFEEDLIFEMLYDSPKNPYQNLPPTIL